MRTLLVLILFVLKVYAQNLILTGYVIDAKQNPIKGVVIELKQDSIIKRTISDTSGFFSFVVKPGVSKIDIKHVAYKQFSGEFKIFTDTLLLIQLYDRVIRLSEVTVTATRYQANSAEISNFVEVISRNKIEKLSPNSFADILKVGTSLYVRDYGGTPAQLKTISLRGTGSEHTVFLLNGMRISSYQNGVLDLSLVPIDVIDRIELIHSNMSPLYGADAIGGVVNIITKNKNDDKFAEGGISLGSFGYRKFNLNIHGRARDFSYISSISRVYGTGNFNYKYKPGNKDIVLKRRNAHFNISNLYLNISSDNISLSALYVRSNRGIPASTTRFDPSSTAAQFDEDLNLSISLNKAFHSFILRTSLFLKNSYLRYTNNDVVVAGSGIDSYSHNLFYSSIVNFIFKKFNFLISSGFESSLGIAEGNSFERARRFNLAFFVSGEREFKLKILPKAKVYPMLRGDYFSDFGGKLIYKIGVNLEVMKVPNLNFKFSYGTGFRAPTFNDLYWAGSGNKNLKPEFSSGFDFGFTTSFEHGGKFLPDFKIEISFFNIDIKNRIVWLPSKENQGIWKPINIDEVNSRGLEIYGEFGFFDGLKVGGNFSLAHSIRKNKRSIDDATQNKHLIYIPISTGNFWIDWTFNKLFFLVQVNYVGLRYTTEMNDRWLRPYYVIDFTCGFNYQIKTFEGRIKFAVKNLLNESYETIVGYPMPLRNYRVEFSFKL